jgi:predicted GNAT family acetyltransferase
MSVDVVNNRDRMRFEIEVDGVVAHLVYRRHGDHLVLVHTEVPAELEGRGVGAALVSAAVDEAVRLGLVVEPQCPFARAWLRRHPDIAGRVIIDWPPDETT